MRCGQELDLSHNSIVGDINNYITLTLTKRLMMSYNNLHGLLNQGANLIAGIVRPCSCSLQMCLSTVQLACRLTRGGCRS